MRKSIIFIILLLVVLLLLLLIPKFNNRNTINDENTNIIATSNNAEILDKTIFTSQEIPNYIYENMLGKSIPLDYKNSIDINSLSYLQVTYFGFDKQCHIGEIIVNSKLSDDVLEIFQELYNIKYPIEKIKLIDEYNANDELSMSDNNTSCFCYRPISGTSKISNHATRHSNRY